jgi:8-oxo-dGTP pyrophosphatase MutT (NUDIX family)
VKTIAKALVLDAAGSILLLRRSLIHPNYPHHFDFPGGEVEDGEDFNEACCRELLEETGIVACKENVTNVHKKQATPNLLHVICQVKLFKPRPSVVLSWEHDDFVWLTLDEFLSSSVPNSPDDYYQTVLNYLRSL